MMHRITVWVGAWALCFTLAGAQATAAEARAGEGTERAAEGDAAIEAGESAEGGAESSEEASEGRSEASTASESSAPVAASEEEAAEPEAAAEPPSNQPADADADADTEAEAMQTDNRRLERFIRDLLPDKDIQGGQGQWFITVEETTMMVVTDERADRMRVMTPIKDVDDLGEGELTRLMEANFDSALDARYALWRDQVWSVTTVPTFDGRLAVSACAFGY